MSVGSGPAIGAELGGYRLEALVGRGGMSAVYRARDLRLGRRVALKVLAAELAEDERFRARFLGESRLAASIDHANIVPIFEAGEAGGLLYIAMRYVEGTDLRVLLRTEGPLAPDRAVALVAQLAEALDAAHARGLVHRDVKPSNALVAAEGDGEHVYLADFGLTKHTTSRGGPTASGQMVGTVEYVAPEQIRGADVDGRADLYSLGCVLFECLTGKVPFPRSSEVATIYAHLEDEPPRASELRPGLPSGLDAVVARALAKQPRRRWQTGAELTAAARAVLPVARRAPRKSRVHRASRRVVLAALGLVIALAAAVGVRLVGGSGGGRTLAAIDANAVAVIDPARPSLTAQVSVGPSPAQIVAGEDAVWVTNAEAQTVSRIDPVTHTVRQTIPVGSGADPIAVGAGGVWVVNSFAGTVSWISPVTNRVVKTVPVGNGPAGICADRGAVWVANADDRTVVRIDVDRGRVTRRIALDSRPTALACHAGEIWASSEASGKVIEMSAARRRVTGAIGVAGSPSAIAYGAGAVWVANKLDGTVSKIDPRRGVVTRTIDVGAGAGPSAIAVDDAGAWVSNEFAGTVARIDGRRGVIVKTLAVGNRPQGIAVVNGALWVGVRASGARHRGGTLRVVQNATLKTLYLDPLGAGDVFAGTILAITNDGLTAFQRTSGHDGQTVVPDLAVSLPAATDGGRTYAFKMQAGVRYSTGVPVRPSDIRRELERVIRTRSAPFYDGIDGAKACRPSRPCDLSRGIVVDDAARTIVFHLRTADPDFLYKLALPAAVAVPPGTPARASVHRPLAATGPYAIGRVVGTRLLVLTRNPHFREWSAAAKPDGYVDTIEWRFGVNGRASDRAVEQGTVDYKAEGVTPSQTVRTRYANQLHVNAESATVWMFLNPRMAPFDHLDVRRALNYAINRRALIASQGGALTGRPTCQILPPNFAAYRPYCPYTANPGPGRPWSAPDLARAKRLIARSGTRGERVRVWVPAAASPVALGRFIVRLLRDLGYRASLRVHAYGAFYSYITNPRHRVQISPQFWFADYPAASDFLRPNFACGANPLRLCDTALDRLMDRAARLQATDQRAANSRWARAERYIIDQAAAVPLISLRQIDFVSRRVGNYQYHPQWGALLDQFWVR